MAEKLTREQQMAVDNRGGKLLVSAAAGSGKTKVLVDRLLKYIMDEIDPANIDEFLIITYTKAAASELRGKIAAKLSEHIARDPGNRHLQRQLQRLYLTKISTVHAFCSDILREYAYRLDLPADFRVGDENECTLLRSRAMEQVLEQAYNHIDSDADFQAFVDTQGLGRSDALVPEIVQKVYDSAMCHISPEEWCDKCITGADAALATDPVQTLWGSYLLEDLFAALDDQIQAMQACVNAVSRIPGLEKPAVLLSDTVNQLRHLRSSSTWDEVIARKNIDYGRLTFPKKADDPSVTEPVKAVRSNCKNVLEKKLRPFCGNATEILEDLEQSAPAARGLIALVRNFSQSYGRLKRQRRVLDFSDLEHKTLDLLLGSGRTGTTTAAREIGDRFREIMVDEYQDSNGVQDAIFSALTQKKQNLFMVGDVKQSIYQFRLADPGIFLSKYATFANAEDAVLGQGRKVLLSSNFRSGGGVIEAVNHVFSTCMSEAVGGLAYGDAEALKEGVPHDPLNEPETELHCLQVKEDTYAEEAAFVADRICQLIDGTHFVRQGDGLRPITAEDVVILLRSPGSVGMEYQHALEQRGIRCASGGGTDLLLTQEIETLRAFLQIISNPRQDIPLLAVLASPVFGFTADDLAQLRIHNRKCCIYDAVKASTSPKAQHFLEILDVLRRTAAMESLPVLLERIFNLTRMDTIFASMEGGTLRKDNLEAFYHLAVDFGSMGGGDLDRFLNHLEALQERGLLATAEPSNAGCVTIMSIHKSKGLEFPVVFLCGLSRRFNQESLRQQVLCHKEMGLGLSCVDSENRVRYPTISKAAIAAKLACDSVSEEMRVLYVALTRARDRLIMTYASQNLEKDIRELALRMDYSGRESMTREVSNPGQWILYSALHRTEAGALFALGGRPAETKVSSKPWLITVEDGFVIETDVAETEKSIERVNQQSVEALINARSFHYAHLAATQAPSKQTATQRKGRIKDKEAAELACEPVIAKRIWRRPGFCEQTASGTTYGKAIHAVLQYIRYENCTGEDAVRQELDRLVREQYITPEQGRMADCGKLAAFFASELGQKLMYGENVLREFKFSILDNAADYGEGLEDEQVLLQGVVDCALVESDGITILDFKTDYVTEETLPSVTAHYRPQVETYAHALSRIFRLPIKGKALYYFRLNRFQWL